MNRRNRFRTRGIARALLVALTLGSFAPAGLALGAPALEKDVVRATLANGLRVIIVRNTLAPVVATSVNYLAGSDEAPAGFPGTAHAQEHMMFRGSPGLTSDQLANIASVMGGNFNANTRESLTQYLFTVPAEDLDVALHIEAARMRDVFDSKQDWDQERGAIEQEVTQDLSNPSYVLYMKLRAALFAGTPYENVPLGTRPSFELTSADMLKSFHTAWYAPNNAILVVVGDVEPRTALATIKQLFGRIRAKRLPARPNISFGPVVPTSFSVDTDRPTATQIVAMRMPGFDSADFPALEVLSDVLTSRRFALYDLVPQGKAIDTEFSLEGLPKAAIGYAAVSFPAGADAKAIEAAVRTILAKAAKDGVPADLVAAAKIKERREAEFQKNSIADLASVWSDAVALYGLRSPQDDLARIEKVTVADVNRVARKYLDLDHAVSAVMLPQGSGKPVVSSSGFGGRETIAMGEAVPGALPDWAQAALSRLVVPASTLRPVVSTLANGSTLIVQPETVSDTVTVFGHIRNRSETETQAGKEGVSQILDRLLSYGSERLDRVAFQQALDEIGASERAGTDFSIKVLAENFERGVELLADDELHPALPEPAMDVNRAQMQQFVAARNQSPGYLAQRALLEAMFPPSDPSLRQATPQTVGALTLEDVRAYHRLVFRPDLATIVVIGNIAPVKARATIEKYFGAWSATGPKPDTDLPVVPPNRPNSVAVPDTSRVQDNVVLAQTLGLTRADSDYYAVALGSAVLGGGFYSSRLSIELRKKAGLVYSVGADIEAGRTRGAYVVQYASDPQNVAKAADIVVREIKQMQAAPVGVDELARAKALVLRQIPLSEASIDGIARGFAERRDLGLPLDEPVIAARRYIELAPADVQGAFRKWLRPDDLVRVTQGPAPQ